MPSIRYYNQSAPFWDFVANLENEGTNHPWFGSQRENREARDSGDESNNTAGPWGFWGGGPPGGFPYRSRSHHHGPPHHGPPHHGTHHHGPPPPPGAEDDVPPPPFEEKEGSPSTVQNEKGEPSGKAPERDHSPHHRGRRCGGPGGFRGRGGCGKRGGPGAWGRGPWGRGGFPFGGHFGPLGGLAGSFFDNSKDSEEENNFKPEADVFDTESNYVVHLSLPGAKKEDISVSWDAEKSELAVSGVVHRPGDEEFLKTLAMNERRIGAFERKIRLGSLANPAQVDVDAISAKLEEGILRIEVPKLDKDYVEVKMVDIE